MKTSALVLVLLWTASTFARGGMIGGGDVTLKSVLECEATGIDSTFSAAKYVWLAEEVNETGDRIANTELRVVTLDTQKQPLQYYVTHESEILSLSKVNISIWRYAAGSMGNEQIGSFQWNASQGTGVFTVEELQLSNCN